MARRVIATAHALIIELQTLNGIWPPPSHPRSASPVAGMYYRKREPNESPGETLVLATIGPRTISNALPNEEEIDPERG